jgi:hypothetical protein
VTFSEPVLSVSAGNFTVVTDGTAAGSIGGFTGGGALYNVTVSGISGTGNLRLNLTSTTPIQDSAGNLLAATANGQVSVIDNTPPAVPTGLNLATASDSGSSNSDDITNVTAVTITGAGETGSTVNLSSNIDGPIGTETVVGGAWSVLTPALSEGVHTITATASDSVGNVSAASVALVVTVDLTPPAAPGVPDLAAGSDSGSFLGANSDNVTNNTTLTFTGTRVAGTRIELRSLVDGVLAPTDSGAGTSYSITPGSAFTEANHPVSARAYDVAGNPSAWSSALTVTVDLTPPSVVSQDPLAGSQVALLPDYDVTFDGAMAPITAGLFSVDGSAATGVSGSGAGPYTFTGFATPADGTGIPVVFAAGLEDRAGNVSAGESWTINRDSSAPSISWSSGDVTSGGVTNSDITLTATFTEDVTGLLDTEISVTNGSVSSFSGSGDTYTFDVSATGDGLVTVVIPAGVADAVAAPLGRVNAASPAFTYTSDTTGPAVVSITPETGGPTNQSTINFTVIWDGPVTGFTDPGDVTVVHIGTSNTGATITPVSATEYNVEVTGVSGEGIMRLRTVAAAAQDPAENDSPQSPLLASGFVSIDSIAPVITVDTLTTTDNRPELTGTVNDTGATVSITVSGQVRSAVVTGSSPNGVWTLADDALLALPDGVYNVSASATDFVGNTGTDATIAELTIDATAPVVTLNGDLIVNVSCGDGYVEEGFTATDNLDGDVSGDVVVSGAGSIPVTTPPGTYVIEYTVTDSLGNIGMAERTVIIEDDCPLAVGVVGPLVFDRDGGDSVTFEISASGNIGPLVYQWFKRASSKAPGDIAVPGGTGPSLTLTDLENDDEGLYYCQVADAVTAVESPNFTLTVFVFVPATGLLGLGLASVVFAAAGGALARRRKG